MSAVTASILVGTKHRVDLGIQPRWIVLLHEANGYAWHLLRLQLSSGDIAPPPKLGLPERHAPGTRPNLDQPPGILWRCSTGGDLVGELALMLHVHAARTPEVMGAVRHLDALAKRRVDLAQFEGREQGDLGNAVRIARTVGGGLYLAATIIAGSRLTESALLELPDWEITLASTVLARDWIRADGGHLEVTDFRQQPVSASAGRGAGEFQGAGAEPGGPQVHPAAAAPLPPASPGDGRGTEPPLARDEAIAATAAEQAQARRYGVRRGDTAVRARVQRLQRERQVAAEIAREESRRPDAAGSEPGSNVDSGDGSWLDAFLRG